MSTTSQRRPNRPHPQRPGSSKGFTIVAERRDPPDLERFVAALLAFTLKRMEQEKAARDRRQSSSGKSSRFSPSLTEKFE
jgi:hypothetical protein